MATCQELQDDSWEKWGQNLEDQKDEVLALESIFEETGRFKVLFTPEIDNGQYSLQIDVPVHLDEEGLMVQAWMPCDDREGLPEHAVADIPAHSRPQFQRTESGLRWHSSFHVNYLPALRLQVVLPQNYPSNGAPLFTLSSLWLDGLKLSLLCKELDNLWIENEGSPVVYTWTDWLENNTVSNLGLESGIVLMPWGEDDKSFLGTCDPRAVPECDNLQEDLLGLLQYDIQQDWLNFRRKPQSCGICFDEKPGLQFYRLQDCRHHFCQNCMEAYCNLHVGEGTVQQLHCPDPDCKLALPPDVLRLVLGEKDYERWERLLLQHTLDTMGDVEWCPRCNFVVIRDAEDSLKLAHCTNCWFSFCTTCRDAWHQGSRCRSMEERIAELEKESKDEADDSEKTKTRRQRLLEKKLEYMSCSTITKTTKPCPRCRAPIEKNMGCNKVTCLCGASMCWLCARPISGYSHFQDGSCAMFPGQQQVLAQIPRWERPVNPEAERVREAMYDPQAVDRIFPCPRCRQRNLKNGRNNHVHCWACKGNICYACRGIIEGTVSSHYRAGQPCRQHSD